MLTHFIKNLNWVDIALAVLFVRVIFIGVKTGVVAEICKLFGTILSTFVALHYYTWLSAIIVQKIHVNVHVIEFIVFGILWALVTLAMKFIRDGLLLLFKVETTHKGFDQYAAGILAVGRGLLVCSLTICMLLLVNNEHLSKMTFKSFSFKISGRAAVGTYAFLYRHLVEKIFEGQHYNDAVDQLVHPTTKT